MTEKKAILPIGNSSRKNFSFYITEDLGKKVKRAADAEKRSVSAFIRNVLEKCVMEAEKVK